MEYHTEPVLDSTKIPGVVLGYLTMLVFLIIAITTIVTDQLKLHRSLVTAIFNDHVKMRELGMDVD
jgi:hypothetical protein